MSTLLDHSVGIAAESTYNTPVTVTRFCERVWGTGMDVNENIVQGQGLRVGSITPRSGRRYKTIGQGQGNIGIEATSKGMGVLLNAAFGTGASTLVSGSTYQQNFTPVATGAYLPSLTLQEGNVRPTGGTSDPTTYPGVTVKSFDLDFPAAGVPMFTFVLDSQAPATATGLATPSYPASPTLYNFSMAGAAGVTLGGALTVPTTNTLATGGTANVNVKAFKISVDNGVDDGRMVYGARNQPTVGLRKMTFTADIEYDATTWRDAFLGQTALSFSATLTTAVALSTGFEQLQVAIPVMMIDSGALPIPKDDKTIVTSISATILDGLVATSPLYLCMRTADTAL